MSFHYLGVVKCKIKEGQKSGGGEQTDVLNNSSIDKEVCDTL